MNVESVDSKYGVYIVFSNGLINWNMEELQNIGKNEGRTEYILERQRD